MKKQKLIKIFSWISVIIFSLITYNFILPILGVAMFLGSLISISMPPLIIIFLIYFLVAQIIITLPVLLFLIIDKKIFKRNLKYISFINIFICILYTIEFSSLNSFFN